MDIDDNERAAKFIQEQVERGAKAEKNVKDSEFTDLKRENDEEKGLYVSNNFNFNF